MRMRRHCCVPKWGNSTTLTVEDLKFSRRIKVIKLSPQQTWSDAGFQAELTSLAVADVYIGPCTHFLFLLSFFAYAPLHFHLCVLMTYSYYFFSPFFPLLFSVPHFFIFLVSYFITCLRQCATSRKVTSSIPDGVIEIFHWLLSVQPNYGPGGWLSL
jgi:hypothetical protein